MSELETPKEKEKDNSWSSRLPLATPPLPSFRPNMTGLRTALLGYLGEVERALQGQTEMVDEPKEMEQGGAGAGGWTSSESTRAPSSDETDDEAKTTAVASTSKEGLRQRGGTPLPSGLNETNMSLLTHLNSLREDILAYLHPKLSVSVPSNPFSVPSIPNREWLRSLPSKLSVVDIGVDSPWSTREGKGKGRLPNIDLGAIDHARKRVLETVRTLLPSEEWAGWERLGWEDQEDGDETPFGMKGRRRTLSASIHRGRADEDDEDEEEPEYLFPNRTPASQQAMAIASRRRQIRSTSFSAALLSRDIDEDDDHEEERGAGAGAETDAGGSKRPGFFSVPLSRRTTGLPEYGDALDSVSDDEVDGVYLQERLEQEELKTLLEHSDIGPTLSEALKRADDGKKLITYDDLPYWWRNNEHIITG